MLEGGEHLHAAFTCSGVSPEEQEIGMKIVMGKWLSY
jgi:hypothetical protein